MKFERVLVLGASGMVGSSVCRLMAGRDYVGKLLSPQRHDLDLLDMNRVDMYFRNISQMQ